MAQPTSQPSLPAHTNASPGNLDAAIPTHASRDWICDRYEIRQALGQHQPERGADPAQHPNPIRTFLAWDHQHNSPVVLKALPFGQLQGWKPLELFEREARSLAQLDHPGIPHYLDYLEHRRPNDTAATYYLVQTYIEGLSLGERVRRGDSFDEATVKAIARQGLEILDYLHSLNPPLLHRDIKPDNIVCRPLADSTTPQIHLVDFGAAQAVTSSGSTVIGTYGYMAPEQFRGQASTASDLYSFGATLLNLLTHQEPVALPTQRLRIDFRSVIQLSDDFALWLDGLLAPISVDRFQSAGHALAALDNPALITSHNGLAHLAETGAEPSAQTASPLTSPEKPDQQPSQSSIRLRHHSGSYPLNQASLTLEIPPIGLQRELWALGGFALLWNGGLLYWLIMAWAMDAPWFYPIASAPLWGVGFLLMGRLSQALFGQVRLVVEQGQYCLEQQVGPIKRQRRGPLSDWQSVELRQQYSRGSEAVQTLALYMGLETVEFGVMLSEAEKHWLERELQAFLSSQPHQLPDA